MHCGKYCWTTQRLQQHLAFIPKKLGYNPCFHALSSQGRSCDYAAVKMPKAVVGLARRESLQTSVPQLEQPTLIAKQRAQWEEELAACHVQLIISDEPPDASERGAQIGDALTACTQQWFQMYYPSGANEAEKQELIDGWIQVLCIDFGDNNVAWDNWLAFVFLAWGDHWLPDIIASFLDGEAEGVVDELYAQFAAELPRYQVLARIAFLETSLRHCVEQEPLPHRPLKATNEAVKHPKSTSQVYQPVPRRFGEHDQWLRDMRQCTFDSIPDAARCPRYKDVADPPTFLVIHLFSGRRRKDDFHDALKTIAAQSCWQVIVLSMDTAVSLEYGNLMIGAPSWSSLIALYMDGRVSATLCGPPCETFSEARFTEAPDGVSRWPRPLRSMSRLFGLEDLTMRELRQCAVGSSFFLQCVWVLCIHIAYGGLFVAEHPALPHDTERPSIWSSPIIQLLLQLPDLHLHHVAQYRWGAEAVKPTGLLVWAMPFFCKDLCEKALSGVAKPTTVAIGKDVQGRFCTARHKEYPGPFCHAIAHAFAQQFTRLVRRNELRHSSPVQPEQNEWISSAAAISEVIRCDANWLPDFQDL